MAQKTLTQAIISKWPSKRALADDITAKTGKELAPIAVYRWFERGSIPPKYDSAIVEIASERAISVSLVDLMKARAVHIDQVGNPEEVIQGQDCQNAGEASV